MNDITTALKEKLKNEDIGLGISAESIDILSGHLAVMFSLDITNAPEEQIRKAELIAAKECVKYLQHTGKIPRDFNQLLSSAINETIQELLGPSGLKTLQMELRTKYDISGEELPYRMKTVYKILETTFHMVGAETIGPKIASKVYEKLGLAFHNHEGYSLDEYIRTAKSALSD